jgi:hypothetical protein
MRKFLSLAVFLGALVFVTPYAMAAAGDVNCCATCCKGSSCIMTHKGAHMCVAQTPCK